MLGKGKWLNQLIHVSLGILAFREKKKISANIEKDLLTSRKSMNFSKLIMANFILVFGYVTFVGETPSTKHFIA